MTITTLAAYQRALKTTVFLNFSGTNTNAVSIADDLPVGLMGAAGNNTSGLVPTGATSGATTIPNFSGTGYLTGVELTCAVSCRVTLYDRVFWCGGFALGSGTTTLSSQPSFSSRIPGGTDYTGLQLWGYNSTIFAGNPIWTITYTDQSGNTGHSTPAKAGSTGNSVPWHMPLQAGDSGIQTIESVSLSGGSGTGSANFVILRPLWTGFLDKSFNTANTVKYWLDTTGAPVISQDACLVAIAYPLSNPSTLVLKMELEIASA